MQRSALPGAASASPTSAAAVRDQLGPGRALDAGIRTQMERGFGHSFADVRIHDDTTAATLSASLEARAFTVGQHVAFGAGEYRPETTVGLAILAHELAHTIQQREADRPGAATAPATLHTEATLEREADLAAASAFGLASGERRPPSRTGLRLQGCIDAPDTKQLPSLDQTKGPTPTWNGVYTPADVAAIRPYLVGPVSPLGGSSEGYYRFLEIKNGAPVVITALPPGKPIAADELRLTHGGLGQRLLVYRMGFTVLDGAGDERDLVIEVWWFPSGSTEEKMLYYHGQRANAWLRNGEATPMSQVMRPVIGDTLLVDQMKREAMQMVIHGGGALGAGMIQRGGQARYMPPPRPAAQPTPPPARPPWTPRVVQGGGGNNTTTTTTPAAPARVTGGAAPGAGAYDGNAARAVAPQTQTTPAPVVAPRPQLQAVPNPAPQPAPAAAAPAPAAPARPAAPGATVAPWNDPVWMGFSTQATKVAPSPASAAPDPKPVSPEPVPADDEAARRKRCPKGTVPIRWPHPVWRSLGRGDKGSISETNDRPKDQVLTKRSVGPGDRDNAKVGLYVKDNWAALKSYYRTPQGTLGAIHHKWPLYLGGKDVQENFVFLLTAEHSAWHSTLTSQTTGPVGTRYCIVN